MKITALALVPREIDVTFPLYLVLNTGLDMQQFTRIRENGERFDVIKTGESCYTFRKSIIKFEHDLWHITHQRTLTTENDFYSFVSNCRLNSQSLGD